MPQLATRFSRNTNVVRSTSPLGEEQMRLAAPSIFAAGKHESRSARYAYVPTIDVLRGPQKEGFQPFMVAQGRSRTEGKAEYTKHMIRMRHQWKASHSWRYEKHALCQGCRPAQCAAAAAPPRSFTLRVR